MALTTPARGSVPVLLALLGLAICPALAGDRAKRPSLSLRASPAIAFAPARIVVRAEVRGGPDDDEDFYCAGVEWDWGDDTRSENSTDCAPYEPGRSRIRRNYVARHVYRQPGTYNVVLRLKQQSRVVASGQTAVQIRAGLP